MRTLMLVLSLTFLASPLSAQTAQNIYLPWSANPVMVYPGYSYTGELGEAAVFRFAPDRDFSSRTATISSSDTTVARVRAWGKIEFLSLGNADICAVENGTKSCLKISTVSPSIYTRIRNLVRSTDREIWAVVGAHLEPIDFSYSLHSLPGDFYYTIDNPRDFIFNSSEPSVLEIRGEDFEVKKTGVTTVCRQSKKKSDIFQCDLLIAVTKDELIAERRLNEKDHDASREKKLTKFLTRR